MSHKARRRPSWKRSNPAYRCGYFVVDGRRVWISKKTIVNRRRQLKGTWTFEEYQSLAAVHGEDCEEAIADALLESLRACVAEEIDTVERLRRELAEALGEVHGKEAGEADRQGD